MCSMNMKVTVCFGSVRVLVPCGAGDLLVRDLVREATHRYKKATGQGPETWVGVRALRASSGGILDPDDRVCDVADDRETLTAECQAQHRAAQADGASGSSAGTASPDMFRGGGGLSGVGGAGGSMRAGAGQGPGATESCVEVGGAALEDGASGLQVRRGSEPSLHQDTMPPQRQVCEQTKRWSAAVVCREETRAPPPDAERAPHGQHFQRHSNRLSMQFSGPGSGVWLDAAERVQIYGSKSLPRDARREPLGQDTSVDTQSQNHRVEDMLRWVSGVNNVSSEPHGQERQLDLLPEMGISERAVSGLEMPVTPSGRGSGGGGAGGAGGAAQTVHVTLVKGEKGLGFTITTRDNPTGGHCPIYIKNILPKGAAVTDGRLRAGDKLVTVNGVSVSGLTQQQVVALLRNTPPDSQVDIVIERTPARTQRVEPQQSPNKYVEKAIGTTNITTMPVEATPAENGRVSTMVHAINHNHNHAPNGSARGRIQKSSSKDDLLNKDQALDSHVQDALNSSTTSIPGLRNRLILRLDVPVHDSEKAGLGISVKGKVTVGPDPQDLGIFIKSVLHGGAASRDGRLHTNDQLVSVNGVSLVGQSNAQAMDTLRRALLHARPHVRGSISLAVARRTDSMDSLARWKDDTPPNGNDTTNSNDHSNSQNFNTIIYNAADGDNKNLDFTHKFQLNQNEVGTDNHDGRTKKHASIVTINNNNSWVSNQSDDSKGYLERDKDSVPHDTKRDSFEWSRLDGWNPVIDRLTGLRNESYYMATQTDATLANGHHYRQTPGHVHMARSPPPHHNVIIEEDYGTTRGGESGSECGGGGGAGEGFSRDAVGRRSMSEKRHAALDAKQTGTYKKIKEIKAVNSMQVGPSLGMRKSSSLESLQTAIQETQKNPRNEPLYARAHPPLKHWLTDDNNAPEHIIRGSPQQSSLSHKKPSLLKSLSTMFRIGKPNKKSENETYGRSQPGRSSEKSLSREALERHNRIDERLEDSNPPPPPHREESSRSRQSSSERGSRSEKRAHAHAHAPPYRAPPPRTAPARTAPAHSHAMDSAWGPTGHYVNYEEIQNFNARREKLSEVQIGQMRLQMNERQQRAKAEEESRRGVPAGYQSQRSCREGGGGGGGGGGGRPQSNYYEYESAPPRRPGKLSHYH
ncbi:PREDICTED: partitioning defective 3 homolog isoform X1 [Papilio xuthus]|uniref:Partitioning defective 3 homolog isoform X1 n=1 Tax=Papilio xuthus TaxID=66420 RepID=A0AAJ7EKB5_PAPXU|nr:PREDICTED: partitioning defective 3 homolog isoform X1 [Papilio xuthus]